VKLTVVVVLPDPLVPVYAIPFPLNEMDTEFAEICVIVIPEVALGVHLLPTVFDKHSAAVPTPAFSVCRSNMIGPPTGPVKVAQFVRLGVRVGAPMRLLCVTEVVPA